MMMHGRNNGKKLMTVRIVKHAFEIIHLLTGENPVQILVDAIINSGPREDSTRIGRAGTVRRQAVDVAPLRRVNQAIWLLCTGAREAAFRNIKTIAECLADELINASKVCILCFFSILILKMMCHKFQNYKDKQLTFFQILAQGFDPSFLKIQQRFSISKIQFSGPWKKLACV